MTEFCDVTGLSNEDVSKFNYLHDFIVNKADIAIPTDNIISSFTKPLEITISKNKIHNNEIKRRESLFKHLNKSIASKFENSKLTAFGSVEADFLSKAGISTFACKFKMRSKRKFSRE